MGNMRIASTIMMVFVSLHIGVAEILTKPTATEVVVGGSTFLNCSTNSGQEIHWFHTPFGSNQERNLVYGYDQFYLQYIGRLTMEKNGADGAYNLVIPSVIIEDAGVYECQDETGRGKKESAELIVLDTKPVCEPHLNTHEIIGPNICGIEPSQLIISCTVDYYGNEAAIMEWRRVSDNRPVSEGVAHRTIDNKRVVYNLTITGNSTVGNGDSYFCNTTRSATSNDGCKSGEIKVKGTENVDCPPVDSGEICKPYSNAIICIIVLSIVVSGIVFAIWYIRVYRPKKRHGEGNSEKSPQEPVNDQEMISLTSPAASQEKTENKSNKISDLQSEIKHLRKMNIDKDATIRSLQSKATSSDEEMQKKSDEIRKLQEQHEYYKRQINEEIIQLEQRLYPAANLDYVEKPTLVHTITTDVGKERREPISGMTILGKELCVSHENKSVIEVYDSETFQFVRNWTIEGISHPMDMASCKIANCVYIIFRVVSESRSHIMKLDPNGQLIKNWPTGGDSGRLSTYKSNVIVCLFEKQLINEYTRDGILIETVPLSPAVGFNHPWHAIKITNGHFVVCHGDTKDELHRVCIVDDQGTIKKELRRWQTETIEGKLNVPICLAEDNSGRSILVADRDNKKIRHLNCFLQRKDNLISALDGYPVRICLDETKGRLFVAENTSPWLKKEWRDGRVLVFNIR